MSGKGSKSKGNSSNIPSVRDTMLMYGLKPDEFEEAQAIRAAFRKADAEAARQSKSSSSSSKK
jgi:hypothetical protein